MATGRGGETRMLLAIGMMVAPVAVLVGLSLALGGRHPGSGALGGVSPVLLVAAAIGVPVFIAGVVLLIRTSFSDAGRRD